MKLTLIYCQKSRIFSQKARARALLLFGFDQFSCFDVYWIKTQIQTDRQKIKVYINNQQLFSALVVYIQITSSCSLPWWCIQITSSCYLSWWCIYRYPAGQLFSVLGSLELQRLFHYKNTVGILYLHKHLYSW